MLLTPTYHVFDLFKVHQDAELLDSHESVERTGPEGELPKVSASASRAADGKIHISLVNLDFESGASVEVELRGLKGGRLEAAGMTLTSDRIDGHNTFDEPERVKPAPFRGFRIEGARLDVQLPPMSVTVLELTAE